MQKLYTDATVDKPIRSNATNVEIESFGFPLRILNERIIFIHSYCFEVKYLLI